MNDFINLIKTIGLPMALGITIALFIGKYFFEKYINKILVEERLESEKKLEKFKSELENERQSSNQKFAIELENIKTELNTNFGNKEYKLISVLAEKIFNFDDMVSFYLTKDNIYQHIFQKKEPIFLDKLNTDLEDLWSYFHANKMYFSNDLEEKTIKILKFLSFYGGVPNCFRVTFTDFDSTSDDQKQEIYRNLVNLELKDYLSQRRSELHDFKSYFDKYEM